MISISYQTTAGNPSSLPNNLHHLNLRLEAPIPTGDGQEVETQDLVDLPRLDIRLLIYSLISFPLFNQLLQMVLKVLLVLSVGAIRQVEICLADTNGIGLLALAGVDDPEPSVRERAN